MHDKDQQRHMLIVPWLGDSLDRLDYGVLSLDTEYPDFQEWFKKNNLFYRNLDGPNIIYSKDKDTQNSFAHMYCAQFLSTYYRVFYSVFFLALCTGVSKPKLRANLIKCLAFIVLMTK